MKQFKKELPIVITRAILGAVAKAGIQYVVNKELAGKDETTKLAGQLETFQEKVAKDFSTSRSNG